MTKEELMNAIVALLEGYRKLGGEPIEITCGVDGGSDAWAQEE